MGRPKVISDQTIIDNARHLFRENQHETTTRQVAQAAAVSHAVLFQRFPTREDLFFKAFLPAGIDIQALLPQPQDLPLQDYLTLIGNNIAALAAEGNAFQDSLLLVTRPNFHQRLAEHPAQIWFMQVIEGVANRLEQLQAVGAITQDINAMVAARVFVDLLCGAALRHFATGADIDMTGIVSLFVRAIQPG